MPDAVLIFTFSPVQSFIAEARRTSDLYVGSQILVKLARAAAFVMQQQGSLIYPATLGDDLANDVPNKLVACVAWEEAEAVAEKAKEALLSEWSHIAGTAKSRLKNRDPLLDGIWTRQVSHQWEIYWAAASMGNRTYGEAYKEASQAMDGAKHTRLFNASEEQGMKDTLSGCREALRTTALNARDFWAEIGKQLTQAKLRPDGRERLDAIGAIKRFSDIAEERRFPSTSTIATRPFLRSAREHKDLLLAYEQALKELLGICLYTPHPQDPDWPYDGDLLFMETLTAQRLKSSYGIPTLSEERLQAAQKALGTIYHVTSQPSPYYALIALDGDGMGERIDNCLGEPEPEKAHKDLSQKLALFASRVRQIVESYQGEVIYNGGDDVLALAPLQSAVSMAAGLAAEFNQVTGGTASSGLAIVHHLYPLDAALPAAREAESYAKKIEDKAKAALCVRAIKRSGEVLDVRSSWEPFLHEGERLEYVPPVQEKRQIWLNAGGVFAPLVRAFQDGSLSSRFAYEVANEARIVDALADNRAHAATLRRLVRRHKTDKLQEPPSLSEALQTWAEGLAGCVAKDKASEGGLTELARWLILARFVAQEESE